MTALVFVAAAWIVLDARQAPAAQEPAPSGAGSILDGVFTAAQATRGQDVFKRACASCHAVSEHSGRTFASKWQGNTMGDLYELVANTMPEADPGSLRPQEYAAILALFLKESSYPEGQQDLPADPAVLKGIRIEPLPR